MRVLVDSSTLIALARIGKLNVLRIIFSDIFITQAIKAEVLREESPDAEVFKEAISRWIRLVDYRPSLESTAWI